MTLTGPGSRDAMKEFARTIGLSPPRAAAAIEVPDSGEEGSDEDPFASAPRSSNAASSSSRPLDAARVRAKAREKDTEKEKKGKGKDKRKGNEVIFGAEPSSDDYGFDFEMDDSFLESVSRIEEEELRQPPPNGKSDPTQRQTQTQTQTQVGTNPQSKTCVNSEGASAKLFSLSGATAVSMSMPNLSTARECTPSTTRKNASTVLSRGTGTPAPGSGGASIPRPLAKRNAGAAAGAMDVINISDEEEEIDKENVPVPTRHVRRRVARQADTDVIELSD